MKLSVEIIDEKFTFEYEIGESKHQGSSVLRPESLSAFTHIVQLCNRVWYSEKDEYWDEIKAKAYMESNLDKAEEYIKKLRMEKVLAEKEGEK